MRTTRLLIIVMVLLVASLTFSSAPALADNGNTLWFMLMTPTDFHLFPVQTWTGPEPHPKDLLETLIAGPPEGPLHATVPSNVRVLEVSVDDGLATVDLSQEILQAPVGSSAEAIMIYSMVNTLCGLPQINRVRFLVEGQHVETLGGHILASEPFGPAWNLVYQGFSDMAGHWAEGQVGAFVLRGIIGGYPDGNFKPQLPISREEFIKLIVKSLDLKDLILQEPTFPDVPTDRWSSPHIERAVEQGFLAVEQYADSFLPDKPIPRKEMAAILARAAGLTDLAKECEDVTLYGDIGRLTPDERGYIGACTQIGLLTGYEDGTFRPEGYLTRAEASTVLVRLLEMGGPDVFLAFPGKHGTVVPGKPLLAVGSIRTGANLIIEMLDEGTVKEKKTISLPFDVGWGFAGAILHWPDGEAPSKPAIRLYREGAMVEAEPLTVPLK